MTESRSYVDIVQEVLNRKFELDLEKKVTLNTRKYFDLVDLNKAVVVKVKESISTNYNDKSYVILRHHIDEVAVNFKTKLRFYLVVNSSVPSDERLFLIKFLEDIDPEVKVEILSSEDIYRLDSGLIEEQKKTPPQQESTIDSSAIEENLNKGIGSTTIGSSILGDSKEVSRVISIGIGDFIKEAKINKSRFYVVDAVSKVNGIDDFFYFKEDKLWVNSNEAYIDLVKQVKVDDYLIMKSRGIAEPVNIIGKVFQNFGDGKYLEVHWHVVIEEKMQVLNTYKKTIELIKHTDVKTLLENLKNSINLAPLLSKNEKYYSTEINFQPEYPIDENAKLIFGQHIGEEILKYNTFFLPIDREEHIREDGITGHVLKTLKVEQQYIRFSEEELNKNGCQWFPFNVNTGRLNLCFIVVTKKKRLLSSFKNTFIEASSSYFISEETLYDENDPLRIFIPLLGTGYAGMKYESSLQMVLTATQRIRKLGTASKIRINLPRNIDANGLLKHARTFIKKLGVSENPDLERIINNNQEGVSLEENAKDKIPFHLDNVESVDRLNREPVAKSLARLINREIFANKQLQHSFMIHLQGEWGSGKSTFLNLIEKHLETSTQKWAVIKYNAWQNQHISPPWWTFIDQVYRQTLLKMKGFNRVRLYFKENSRRVLWYSGWYNIITLIISILLLIGIVMYGDEIVGKLTGSITLEEGTETDKIDLKNRFKIYTEVLLGLGSIVGIIFSFSRFISTPLLMKSSGEAKSFMLRASDPMNRIKKHFNKLIGDINKRGCDVAVFIDDIDRCNKEYTVELLEGIQTLFKDKRVLYIVAGDKNWITTCFSKNYEDFIANVSKNDDNLGELFLEKAFQLSVRMPNVSEQTKQQYWHHILGAKERVKPKKVLSELTTTQQHEIKKRVVKNYADTTINNVEELDSLEEEYGLSEESISDIAIEALDESSKDIRHLFLDHYKLIDPNPRAIKRLANNYTMYRNTLIAERKNFNPNKLFRWLILQAMYPTLIHDVLKYGNFNFLDEESENMQVDETKRNDLNELIYDHENQYGGTLQKEELELITGI